jgi:hypothetical protein
VSYWVAGSSFWSNLRLTDCTYFQQLVTLLSIVLSLKMAGSHLANFGAAFPIEKIGDFYLRLDKGSAFL